MVPLLKFIRPGELRHTDRRVTPDMLPEAAAPPDPEASSLLTDVMDLPVKQREVILLYYYQEMDVREVAKALGITKSSVSGRLKSARDNLRRLLEGRETE